jgi:hypothetical protein
MEPLGSLGGQFGRATAISADGSIVFGSSALSPGSYNSHLFRWTRAAGMGISAVCPAPPEAMPRRAPPMVRSYAAPRTDLRISFPSGGPLPLGVQEISSTVLAVAISADGSTILGQKTPGYRWTGGSGFQPLPAVPLILMDIAVPEWISSDGATVLGTVRDPTGDLNAAYRWNATTGYEFLTVPFTQPGMVVDSASPDGSIILGRGGFGQINPLIHANGVAQDAWAYLQKRGASFSGWTFLEITGVAADNRTFVGYGRTAAGTDEGWIVKLPAICYINCDSSTQVPCAHGQRLHLFPEPLRRRRPLRQLRCQHVAARAQRQRLCLLSQPLR